MFGCVVHIGDTTTSGHYTCIAYDFRMETFVYYNDAAQPATMSEERAMDYAADGYIFCYMSVEVSHIVQM